MEPDPVTIARVTAAATLAAIVLAGILVLVAIGLRFSGRRPGRRLGTAVVFLFGFQLGGFIVFLEGNPIARAVTLGAIGLLVLMLLWRDRRVQAGALLAGSALPWTLVWGYYVFALVTGEPDFDATTTWALFLAGALPAGIGLGLVAAGDPLPPEPSPTAPPGQPGSRKVGIVARVVLAPESIGPIPISEIAAFITEVATILAVGAVGIPFPLEAVAQIGLAALAGNGVRIIARPRRARRAFEAFSWLGEWEMQRARAQTGHGAPMSESHAGRWLEEVPEEPATRWIRVEVLQWLDRLDEARAVAERMPVSTPYERFEQRAALDTIDWMSGGDGDPQGVIAAADEIPADDEEARLRASVVIAIRESARIAAEQGPEAALEPLLRARDVLGARADNQLFRALWRRYLPVSVATAVIVWVFVGAIT